MDMKEIQRQNAHKKVILFNGPPSSGKDTAAIIAANFLDNKYISTRTFPYRTKHMKFAGPLKAAAHALYGIPYSCEYYEKELGPSWKNEPQVEFYGNTPREEYIALSEEFAKRRHGNAIFGRVAARAISLEKQANVFIFSDSGFAPEAIPVISLVGIKNVLVCELHREGTNFNNDSRGYIGDTLNQQYGGNLTVQHIPNHSDKFDLRLMVLGAMSKHFKVEL